MDEITFEDIAPLFGQRIDTPDVIAFLAKYPEHRITKPSDGAQYVIFKSPGFDLLFRPLTGLQGGRSSHVRVLICVFLYREGKDKHKQFPHPPFEIAFADQRDALLTKLGEPVAVSDKDEHGNPGWEKWHVSEWEVHTMYDRTTMTTQVFTISKASDKKT